MGVSWIHIHLNAHPLTPLFAEPKPGDREAVIKTQGFLYFLCTLFKIVSHFTVSEDVGIEPRTVATLV